MRKLLFFLLCFIFTGCAAPQIVKNNINTQEKVIFIIPSEYASEIHPYAGLKFSSSPRRWISGNFWFEQGATINVSDADQIEVKYVDVMIGSSGQPIGSFKNYVFKANKYKENLNTKIEFIPLSEIIQPDDGFFMQHPLPVETVSDAMSLLSQSGNVTIKFEVDSKYDADSVFGNFTRLLSLKPLEDPVEMMGNQFSSAYYLKSDNKTIATCYIDVVPYRNGSKAVIIANIPLSTSSKYYVDATGLINGVKEQITNIVND